jgi:phage terminase large subunit-like protein
VAVATSKPRRKKPKARYFKGIGAQVAKFAEEHVVQTKGRWAGTPLHFEQWQRDVLDELYLVTADNRRVYREALIGIPRKNGKSTMCAAIALHGLIATGEQGPEVYVAAGAKDQARIVFQQAKEFVQASPRLLDWLQPLQSVIRCKANNGIFRVLSSDAPLQHGLNPSLVVMDELHAHPKRELYYALTTGSLARLDPLIVSITTAGFDRETVCWDVFDRGEQMKAEGGLELMRKEGFLHHWIAAPAQAKMDDRDVWQKANPATWVTNEVLDAQFRALPENVFRRLHLNQWTEAEDAWIRPDEFDACAGRPRLDPDKPQFWGLDIGITRDATALVRCQWRGDKLHVKHHIIVPVEDHPVETIDTRARVLELASKNEGLKELAFDPYQFTESAEILSERGLPMVQYDQNPSTMGPASERLYELFRDGRIVHDANHVFRDQVLSAVAAPTERGWRISKRKSKARIDACVALAMAADRAVLSRLGPPPLNPADYRIQAL